LLNTSAPSRVLETLFPALSKRKQTKLRQVRSQSLVPEGIEETKLLKNADILLSHEIPSPEHSPILRDTPTPSRIQELEKEVIQQRIEKENMRINQIELTKSLQTLQKDREMFEKWKSEQQLQIQKFRENELKNLRTERVLWEKSKKANDVIPTKKERLEIESLKKNLQALNSRLVEQKQTHDLEISRFKRQLKDAKSRIIELEDEVKIYEHERVFMTIKSRESPSDTKTEEKQSSFDSPTPIVEKRLQKKSSIPRFLNHKSSDSSISYTMQKNKPNINTPISKSPVWLPINTPSSKTITPEKSWFSEQSNTPKT
ncbi:hypothetical protein HK096_011086, partial [Nowakowskiella sp. JEL0078]